MSQIATKPQTSQTSHTNHKDRHAHVTCSRGTHNDLREASRMLTEAGEEAAINQIVNDLVAAHLPAYVRSRLRGRAAAIRAEADRAARELEQAAAPARVYAITHVEDF